jgi:hypothetical protein
MVKHLRFSYTDVLKMPVWERALYIDLWQKEMEEQQKQYKKAQSKGKSR